MAWKDWRENPVSRLAVRRLAPRMELRQYVRSLLIFESAGGLTGEELQVVIPNGSAKLMLYYKGDYKGLVCELDVRIPEHKLFVVGISDSVAVTEFDRSQPFGCICMELHPAFAYRFLAIPQHQLFNRFVPFEELVRPTIHRRMEERIYMAADPVQKAHLLQEYLMMLLALTEPDARFEYSVSAIWNSRGLLSIAELSQDLGLSDRWLRNIFAERLGLSPKTFASLVRFQACFQALLHDKHDFLENQQFHDFYYDQAHFIREFKRYLGNTPAKYSALQNELDKIIYSGAM